MDDAGNRHGSTTPRVLVIETSHRTGLVAVAAGDRILGERRLDEARRHARDLVPAIRDLLAAQGWRARELDAVVVSRGPGSYTGLRVGLMSAKTLAYATGCTLLAVETFAAIARQAPADALAVDVIADAQQDKLYVQRFARQGVGEPVLAVVPLAIQTFAEWSAGLPMGTYVSGPGLEKVASRLPPTVGVRTSREWQPDATSLVRIGLERLARAERDDPIAIEPLYLRPSSAEEQLKRK